MRAISNHISNHCDGVITLLQTLIHDNDQNMSTTSHVHILSPNTFPIIKCFKYEIAVSFELALITITINILSMPKSRRHDSIYFPIVSPR